MFPVFQRYVSSVFSGRMLQVCLSGCCICFTHTLHVFYLDVAYGCNGFQVFSCVFLIQVFQKHVSSVSTVFRRMLQLLYLDVSKVDRVLYLSSPPSITSSLPAPTGHLSDAAAGSFRIGGAVRPSPLCCLGNASPAWSAKRSAARWHLDTGVRPDASTTNNNKQSTTVHKSVLARVQG